MSRGFAMHVALAVVTAAPLVRAEGTTPDPAVEFVRVVVPADRLRDVPLDGGRLVPMPLAEFDGAVASLMPSGVGRGPRPLVAAATYDLAIDSLGRLAGSLEFDVPEATSTLATSMPLGPVCVERATLRSADRTGEAVLFGDATGGVSIRTATSGTYACDIAVPPIGPATYRLPLVPALTTRLGLRLPPGTRPVVARSASGSVLLAPDDGREHGWRVDVVGLDAVELSIVPIDAVQPRVRCWNRVGVRGRQVDVAVRVVPERPWRMGPIALRKDPRLDLVQARFAGGRPLVAEPARDASRFIVEVPAAFEGTSVPIDITGVAEATLEAAFPLPIVRSPTDRWAGGGVTVVVDPAFAVSSLDLEESVVVAPVAGERWPLAAGAATFPGEAATIYVEQQSPAARASLTITRREPRLDTVRVTTVELSPGAVIGRAACDIRVGSGEAFVITARIAPEWFIDSVEVVEWASASSSDEDAEARRAIPEPDRAIDWRVIRGAGEGELRIGLAEAATPSRSLGLRITGHRRGVPIGSEFQPGDLDMVRLDGETAESAIVDYRVGPDAVIEVDGEPLGMLATDGRFAPLVEPGTPRGRAYGGDRVGTGTARLVRRRPPLHADVAVQVVARDSRITESLSFTCSPEAGAVDSVVVTVSEPLGDAVEWSLDEPAEGTLYARRLEAAGRDDGGAPAAARESWLVEVRPAVQGAVAFRATRTQPFTTPVPVPLAWVDGATDARGTLVVRGAGGTRPGVVNRGLAERPPAMNDDRAAAVVTELTYGPAETLSLGPDQSPVVVVPPDMAEARAWVWREATTAWCHDSGWIECDSQFDIENRGRADVALTVPPGMRLDEVTIDGEPAAFDGVSEAGGTSRVLLPTGRGRVRLHVRGIASRDPSAGIWRIDPITCAIDVPLLDRTLRLKMPSDLELFQPGRGPSGDDGWVERLFDATVVPPAPATRDRDTTEAGFRVVDMPSVGAAGIYAVRRRLVSSSSVLAAVALAAATWLLTRSSPRMAVTLVVGAALAALWVAAPFVAVARAAWWGGLVGLGLGSTVSRPSGAVRTLAILVLSMSSAFAADGGESTPYRVYITPGADGGTALVPEPMFRRLSADAAGRETVRVRTSRLVIQPTGAWRLELDVDADQGGVLNIDQSGADVRCSRPAAPGEAVAVDVTPDGSAARAVVALAGLRRITIDLTPRPHATGSLERVVVRMPPAAGSRVEIEADGKAGGARWQCDRAGLDRRWRPVEERDGVADVSGASLVRLTRSTDPRQPLVAVPEKAESVDELWWGEDACVVNATFDVDPGRGLVRSLVVRADEPLAPVDGGGTLVSLGGGRFLVEFPEPIPGRFRVAATFAMSLDDPTGVFDVPRVWLESVATDVRTVRCSAAAGLDLTAELPPGYSLLRPRDGEAAEPAVAWRSEEVATAAGSGAGEGPGERVATTAAERPRPRVAVRRRPVPPRIAQRLDVTVDSDEIDLALDCQIDARSGPLTGISIDLPEEATVDRVSLVDEGSDGGAVDVHVSRPEPARLLVLAQRPRPGIYRLSLAAHVDGRPPAEGVMPVVRCITADESPVVLRWRSRGGVTLSVRSATAESGDAANVRELAAGEPAPAYVIETAAEAPSSAGTGGGPPVVAPADVPLGNSVEGTVVHLAIDESGRIWGLARFELVASDPVVRIRFPAGFRLFDLLVDGREIQALPAGAQSWDVRLHDVRWPRSILAVFAGQAAAADAGGAVRLEPPRLEGLECRDVLWRIDAPTDMQVRVAEPAQVVGVGAWRQAQAALRGRVADLFQVAVEGALDHDRDRLRAFADARESGGDPPLESEWERAFQGPPDAGRTRVHILGAGNDGLTIRTARRGGGDAGGRATATAGLVAALIVGGVVAGWQPVLWSRVVAWLWPWAILSAGAAWTMLLRPTLPGWALIVAGMVVIAARWRVAGPSWPLGSAAEPR